MAYVNKINVQGTDYDVNDKRIPAGANDNALPILEKITDANGHARFVEGAGTPEVISGFSSVYCRWSLSGTHIMLVLAGSLSNGTALSTQSMASFSIPQWVANKIYPVWADDFIEIKDVVLSANDWTSQNAKMALSKYQNTLIINNIGSLTLTADRSFRVQFDLLIDNA